MKLYLNDEQIELLIKTLAVAHMIEFMKGNDNSALEKLIAKLLDSLVAEGKKHIFEKVFIEVKHG